MLAHARRALLGLALLIPAAPALAQKSYTNDFLASNGVRLEAKVKAAKVPAKPVTVARKEAETALGRKDWAAAGDAALAGLKTDPKDWTLWRTYADAQIQIGLDQNNNQRWEAKQAAETAAFIAYQRATNPQDEAAALAGLARVYQAEQSWRSALNVYRASLKIKPDPAVQQVWAALREKYGFKLNEYKLDSDAASPRVCFQFSELLLAKVKDYAPYVSAEGLANPAISADGAQLCVDGLEHGKRYAFTLRQGLPSDVDEELLKAQNYEFYVKDRAPKVRFTGKNYVLPRTGQEGLPVVTVNARKVEIDIYRIGDRNLINSVQGSDFLNNLETYKAETIRDESGQKVWTGTMDVAGELNKDTTTAFPVLEAVGKIEPGLYVMTSRVPGARASENDEGYEATQWFVVSDFGLTAMSGAGGVDVLVRSLDTARPKAGVEVRLVAKNNEILQTRQSDAEGRVTFDPGISRGTGGMQPGLVIASDASGDYGFLALDGEAFDLTDRGVGGRETPTGLDAFVFTERGVYRTGESVDITALLRDAKSAAVPNLPLTMIIQRPDGVEYKKQVVADQGLGGRAWSVPLLSGVPTGTWRVEVYADPKRPMIGETTFLVEDYVADRIDVTLKAKRDRARPGEAVDVSVTANFLYGAPGSDLALQGTIKVDRAKQATIPGLADYDIGIADETFEAVTQDIEEAGSTDEKGTATVSAPMPSVDSSRPLEATVSVTVGEEGGRGVTREVVVPILPAGPVIAVKKLFKDEALVEGGGTATFDVVMAAPSGELIATKGVKWEMKRVERRYQWFSSSGRWDYEVVKSSRRVADGVIDTLKTGPVKVAAPVDFGSYVIEFTPAGTARAATSVAFTAGYGAKEDANAPDVLDVKLDKDGYADGEDMKVHLAPRFEGTATVMVVSDHVEVARLVEVGKAGTTVSLKASKDWGAQAYVLAVAHRPMEIAAHRMPGRAVGVKWFQIDRAARMLSLDIGTEPRIRPRGTMTVPVAVSGLAPGEEARIVVAAVDLGILNLTRYKTPDPEAHYTGQRLLGVDLRDLYGYLIDGMQGARGAIKSGGDGGLDADVSPPREAPLARYSGVVVVGPDGKAKVEFDLPAFNGTVRVMAVAWSAGKVGHGEKDVIVRDPVVVQATLPRFLRTGDQTRLHLAIDNVEGEAGDYVVDLDVAGPLTVAADQLHGTLKLAKGARGQFVASLTGTGIGTGTLTLRLTGPGGIDAGQSMVLGVTPPNPVEHKRMVQQLAAGPDGAPVTLSTDLMADYLPTTAMMSVAVSPIGAFDVPALLKALDRYPYGCSEQLVSRALPLLYANKLAAEQNLALDDAIDARVKSTIERLLTRQDSQGQFGLWTSDDGNVWLSAYVVDFLTRARERGFDVPQAALESSLDWLRNTLVNAEDVTKDNSHDLAYAAYVLARNGRPVIGDIRYLTDTKLADFSTPLAQAQMGAALALLGDKTRAAPIFTSALAKLEQIKTFKGYRMDYGTTLRDAAAIMALMSEAGLPPSEFVNAARLADGLRQQTKYTSTQENAWMVMAAATLAKEAAKQTLDVNGEETKGVFYRNYRAIALDGKPVTIRNTSAVPTNLVIDVSGHPIQPLNEIAEGYKIERSFHKLDGTKIDPAKVKQTDRMVVVLKITEQAAEHADLMVVDHLPAGFEIDNPNLVGATDLSGFDWLESSVEPTHKEYRDDRFVATFSRDPAQSAFFHVAYTVRVVSPGRFVLPAATAEDMYRPWRFGRTATGRIDVAPVK